MKIKLLKLIERIVDDSNPRLIDIIAYIIMGITSISTIYLFYKGLSIVKSPILDIHPVTVYTILIISTVGLFFLTMLGDKTSKPVNRPKIFLFTASILCILTYCLLAEILNYTFTVFIDSLIQVTEVPSFLIHTNVRIFTVFVPLLIVILVYYKSLSIPFDKTYRKELLEYQLDILTRNVHKVTGETIDIKICEDVETGKDVIVSEKITFSHKMIVGSTGSGKTALSIRPDLAQLFYMKAHFREKLKELAFKALEEELCFVNKPVTNKYINENFSMDLITVKENKKEKFLELFKDYIEGVRSSDKQIYSDKVILIGERPLLLEIPILMHSDIDKVVINIKSFNKNMILEEVPIEFKNEVNTSIKSNKGYEITVVKKPYTETFINENNEEEIRNVEKINEREKKIYTEYLEIKIIPNIERYSKLEFKITVDEKGKGKIIYKNLGVTVIAPDGGLAENTVEIADENGIKVHKIDPKMEEIRKGNIAKFNPLLGGTPEKAADIVSSILIAMEQNSGKDNNPYYTNASIRAIRNVVILLRVTYPLLHNGENPILTDVLDMLNNFNSVRPYVKELQKDSKLKVRWKSVIDYFETSFYPPPYDDNDKKVRDTHIGSKTKKTEEAISGMINQLDNFLGREEIRYILCDRYNSLNLSEVLETGECLAVSTRQSELGDVLGKAFALMIILSIQNAVLGRYSEDENPEIPFFLFIDEFPFYLNDQTKIFFTFARKYKCSVNIAIQGLAQLEEVNKVFRQVVFTGCTTKLVLPGANVEDRDYFRQFFGIEEDFEVMTSVTSNPVITENAKYSEAARGSLQEKDKISTQDLAELKFKRCYYSTVDQKGNTIIGKGYMDFLKLTPDNTVSIKEHDFEKYVNLNLFDIFEEDEGNDIVSEGLEDIKENISNNGFQEISEESNKDLEDTLLNLMNKNINLNNIDDFQKKDENILFDIKDIVKITEEVEENQKSNNTKSSSDKKNNLKEEEFNFDFSNKDINLENLNNITVYAISDEE